MRLLEWVRSISVLFDPVSLGSKTSTYSSVANAKWRAYVGFSLNKNSWGDMLFTLLTVRRKFSAPSSFLLRFKTMIDTKTIVIETGRPVSMDKCGLVWPLTLATLAFWWNERLVRLYIELRDSGGKIFDLLLNCSECSLHVRWRRCSFKSSSSSR